MVAHPLRRFQDKPRTVRRGLSALHPNPADASVYVQTNKAIKSLTLVIVGPVTSMSPAAVSHG